MEQTLHPERNTTPETSNLPEPTQDQTPAQPSPSARHFPLFALGNLLYSAFYAFCLYRNASGVTYPFFVVGTLCFFFFSLRKSGVPSQGAGASEPDSRCPTSESQNKPENGDANAFPEPQKSPSDSSNDKACPFPRFDKTSAFYAAGMVLLGLSNCMTASPQLLLLNKGALLLLALTLALHTVYNDSGWDLQAHFLAALQIIFGALARLFRPFGDMFSYFNVQKEEKTGKKSIFLPLFIGFVIAAPLLFFMTMLLASADLIFQQMVEQVFEALNVWSLFEIGLLMAAVFFGVYGTLAALTEKTAPRARKEKSGFNPLTAIVITGLLAALYSFFSLIQLLYLFPGSAGLSGSMRLPDGYTYAGYAREGFFQLLAVSVINLLLVLAFLALFRESRALKAILTLICGCTFVMILSSGLRMVLYINAYTLTFMRVFVLWALAVIFLLMAGVTLSIHWRRFPLFRYGTVVLTLLWLAFSFARPDYWIARFDLTRQGNREYLCGLSPDAAPAILDPAINPDFSNLREMLAETSKELEDGSIQDYFDLPWLRRYYDKVEGYAGGMGLRSFNFSVYQAEKFLMQ